jgi:hypothetical protein
MNLLEMSVVTNELSIAKIDPFNKGIVIANTIGNIPNEKNDCSFLPLVIPMSKRKIARNPYPPHQPHISYPI